jgi:hypothetical protein
LIERLPNSFRYHVTEFGLRVALFFTRTYNRILRPGLAAALPSLRAIDAPLKRHTGSALARRGLLTAFNPAADNWR